MFGHVWLARNNGKLLLDNSQMRMSVANNKTKNNRRVFSHVQQTKTSQNAICPPAP
jgi:hypothetical protein